MQRSRIWYRAGMRQHSGCNRGGCTSWRCPSRAACRRRRQVPCAETCAACMDLHKSPLGSSMLAVILDHHLLNFLLGCTVSRLERHPRLAQHSKPVYMQAGRVWVAAAWVPQECPGTRQHPGAAAAAHLICSGLGGECRHHTSCHHSMLIKDGWLVASKWAALGSRQPVLCASWFLFARSCSDPPLQHVMLSAVATELCPADTRLGGPNASAPAWNEQ
jgi:hypothetical protein